MRGRIISAVAAVLLLLSMLSGCQKQPESRNLPILMYHHLDQQGDDSATVSIQSFRRQMALLKQEGYTPISLAELAAFAEGAELPEKPVLITFDDGYASNYTLAYPVLQEYQFPAAIFVIGSSAGKDTYKDTHHPIIPHFGEAEAKEMLKSGLITLQTHTYDLHQSVALEQSRPVRKNILPLEGESGADYIAMLTADHQKELALLAEWGVKEHWAIAYPGGATCPLTESTMQKLGLTITLTTDEERINTVTQYAPQALIGLGRLSVHEAITDEMFLDYLHHEI